MKYKVLLSGNNRTIMNEFFTYMDFSFDCMSCSDRYDDIVNHVKYIAPDVFVYCLYGEKQDDIKRFCNAERKIAEKKIPVVVIGDEEDCNQFERIAPFLKVTVLRKPLSYQNIETAVLRLLGALQEPEKTEDVSDIEDTDPIVAVKKFLGELESLGLDFNSEKEKETVQEKEDRGIAIPVNEDAVNPEEKSGRKHILVVDDDRSVLKLIKSYLTEKYDVATAINGKVAMKFLETKRTDLILLDYEMPEESGVDILNKIRADENLRELPVVFLTGVSERDKIQEVLLLKPQGYLLKPIDMERLSSTIEAIL